MTANKPYLECPSFDHCSVNQCPLDPMSDLRMNLPDDLETTCKARISTRQKIASKYGLANRGRTPKELRREERSRAAKERWEALPEETKMRLLEQLKEARERAKRGSESLRENDLHRDLQDKSASA